MTDRRTASTITDTELDQLYDRAARAEAALARVRAALPAYDGPILGDRSRGAQMGWDRARQAVLAALDQPTAGPAATQTTDRHCLFARSGARPCNASDRCATCDTKEQPGA